MLFPLARQSASDGEFSDAIRVGMLDNRLGAWWRMGGFPGGFPYVPRRPVNFDTPGPPAAATTPPAAVPPAIVPQLVGQFTTRRTQLFGPFANLQ